MDKSLILQILEIGELADEGSVKAAYLAKLKTANPEDDPEGFRRIRRAYEAALELLRAREEETEEKEKTYMDLWLDRVDQVYRDFTVRGHVEAWEELLGDPVCQDLDTSLEARDAMLGYLCSHFFLPRQIWKRLDEEFQIVSDTEELKGRFPADFLDYIRFYTENDYYIDFDQMSLRDGADREAVDVDGYIRAYQELRASCDRGEWKKAVQQKEEIEAYGVFYPWEAAERLRVRSALYRTALEAPEMTEEMSRLQREKLLRAAEKLAGQYGDSQYIMTHAGNIQWEWGDHEKALACWQKAPDNYEARCGVIQYYLEDGRDAGKAKDMALEMMEDNRDDRLSQYLIHANQYLIACYQEKLDSADDEDVRMETLLEIAWCRFQNQEMEESLGILEKMEPTEALCYSYHNLKGRVLAAMSRFQEAVPELETWLSMIRETVNDGSEEARKRLRREGDACFLLGWSRYKIGQYQEAAADLEKGLEKIKPQAERLSCMNTLAEVWMAMDACEKAADLCSQIIALERNYYPAYLNRQEAYFRLKDAQQVVDDYHRAVEIYPGYYKPYLLAEKVFFFCGQYEDALDVVKRAEENQAELSDEMRLYRCKARRNLAHSYEERRTIAQELLAIKESLDRENTDLEDISELDYELGLLYSDNEEPWIALEYIQKAIHQNPYRLRYFMARGAIQCKNRDFHSALESYIRVQEEYGGTAAWYYGIGCCCEGLGEEDIALTYYEKAVAEDSDYLDTAEKIIEIYMNRYRRNADPENFCLAIQYMDREVEKRENCYTLVHRGLMYMEAMELTKAIADFEKALTCAPDDWAAYNSLGYCYQHLKQFQKSIEMYEKSLECLEKTGEKKLLLYSNMADSYEILREYGKAICCCETLLKWFPQEISFYEKIGDLYMYMGEYDKAVKAYKRNSADNKKFLKIGDVCMSRGKKHWAKLYYKKCLRCSPRRSYRRNTEYAVRLMYYYGDSERALNYLKKAERMYQRSVQIADQEERVKNWPLAVNILYMRMYRWSAWNADRNDREKNRLLAARIAYLMGDRERAASLAEELREIMLEGFPSEEAYLGYLAERPWRLNRLGECCLYLGERDKALFCFHQAGEGLRCKFCREPECYERFVGEALYHMDSDREQARACCERALEICPNDMEFKALAQIICKSNAEKKHRHVSPSCGYRERKGIE